MDTTEQAKRLICDILAASEGRMWGKTRLYKAFYAAHLYYWRYTNECLTHHPIVRMPNGPGIEKGTILINQLESEGAVCLNTRNHGPYLEQVFDLATPYTLNPMDTRHRAVLDAVGWIGDRTAAELTQETHEYSRSWNLAYDGEEMDIYLDVNGSFDEEEVALIGDSVNRVMSKLTASLSKVHG